MKEVERLAAYVHKTGYEDLSAEMKSALKIRILDSLGCAIGALGGEPIARLRKYINEMGGTPLVSLIGGGKTSPDRATFYNGALVRYLDFNDSFLAKKETCHPSDNLSAVLASCEYAKANGKMLLLSLAVAYQVQCRLSEVGPVRDKGFDHTTQGAYAAAAGAARALSLPVDQIAHAIAISGVANNALRVTRTGALSHWKGLAYPNTASAAVQAAFLAMNGLTGPLEIFEGNKGFMHSIAGKFHIDWEKENLDAVLNTIIKKYNAEIHSQSTLEGIMELRKTHKLSAESILKIEVDIFDVAFHIIGGGEEGGKKEIRTKEEADHSLPYMIAAAILDGEVTPKQYEPQRILKSDIQNLLKKISIRPDDKFSQEFPQKMKTKIQIYLKDGQVAKLEKSDYEGFTSKPMSWETVCEKFDRLSVPYIDPSAQQIVKEMVNGLESIPILELTNVLSKINFEGKI